MNLKFWQWDWSWIEEALQGDYHNAPEALKPALIAPVTPKPMPTTQTKAEQLYTIAKACLGVDMSPVDIAPDRLACAESLNGVFFKAFNEHLGTGAALTSTCALYQEMVADKRLQSTIAPIPGDIVISPTGYSTKKSLHGHCGVWGDFDVMSNDSDSGKWKDNYSHQAWYDVFSKELGFPVYFFHVL